MKFVPTELPEVVIVTPEVLSDSRGHLFETYHGRKFAEAAIDAIFVQDTQSRSAFGVIRGLHAQRLKPQAKMMRVLQGAIVDVAVDIRKGSPTFARWVAVELSAENRRMLFVPRNFAHGFCVTSTYAEVEYKSSNFYQPRTSSNRLILIGVKWRQPTLFPTTTRRQSDQLIEQLPVSFLT